MSAPYAKTVARRNPLTRGWCLRVETDMGTLVLSTDFFDKDSAVAAAKNLSGRLATIQTIEVEEGT